MAPENLQLSNSKLDYLIRKSKLINNSFTLKCITGNFSETKRISLKRVLVTCRNSFKAEI